MSGLGSTATRGPFKAECFSDLESVCCLMKIQVALANSSTIVRLL